MLDIKWIIENPEIVKDSILKRHVQANINDTLAFYAASKAQRGTLDEKRAQANRIAKTIPTIKDASKQELIDQGRALNHEITELENTLRITLDAYHEAMLTIPNRLADDTPLGKDDDENLILRSHLTPRIFDFTPKDHVQIGHDLDLIDFESGSKVTGAKFYFLKNQAVFLEMALKLFAMNLAQRAGYTPLITPDLAKKSILTGIGFSPRGAESNIYNLEDLDLSLIATAEITMGGMHADELLNQSQLPLKYAAESHCFRREAGSGGKENKGLYRVHQFSKIELFQITTPETAEAALEEIVQLEETIYQQLQLPYRVMRICAGDLGATAYKKYDLEAWMPGRDSTEKYGEITSASNCTDYQSRRLNIRYQTPEKKKIYPYTLNGTAIALSRTLMAILENYQQADGSVIIPEVLRPYVGFDIIRRP